MKSEKKKMKLFMRRDGFILLLVWNLILVGAISLLFVFHFAFVDQTNRNEAEMMKMNENLMQRAHDLEEENKQQN